MQDFTGDIHSDTFEKACSDKKLFKISLSGQNTPPSMNGVKFRIKEHI